MTLDRATESERTVIQNLAQFYTYDMSKYCGFLPGWETPKDGQYSCFDLGRYWEEPQRYPLMIRINHEIAGFALIHKIGTTQDIDWTIGEFFIVAKFQNKGIGRKVAFTIFNQFHGIWEVMQMPENKGAIDFWVKVIDEYTGGEFEKTRKIVSEPKPHPMLVMKFSSNPFS